MLTYAPFFILCLVTVEAFSILCWQSVWHIGWRNSPYEWEYWMRKYHHLHIQAVLEHHLVSEKHAVSALAHFNKAACEWKWLRTKEQMVSPGSRWLVCSSHTQGFTVAPTIICSAFQQKSTFLQDPEVSNANKVVVNPRHFPITREPRCTWKGEKAFPWNLLRKQMCIVLAGATTGTIPEDPTARWEIDNWWQVLDDWGAQVTWISLYIYLNLICI